MALNKSASCKTNANWRQKQNSNPYMKHHLNDENLLRMNNNNTESKFGESNDDDIESCYSVQTQLYLPHDNNHKYYHSTKQSEERSIQIKDEWRKISYNPNNVALKTKISQIIKYGEKGRGSTKSEYLINYGTRILHTNINNDILGIYDGGWEAWKQWFLCFMGNNIYFDLDKVFKRIDLFGLPMICGKDLRLINKHNDNDNNSFNYYINLALCRKGWLNGLKYLIETLQINHIKNEFEILSDTVYTFNDDILKYLLIENNNKFYDYFDIDTKCNKYKETLWICCRKQFESIIRPKTGWLHCLECLHFAPYLIQQIHGININHDDDIKYNEEGLSDIDDDNNWMIKQLHDININIETIKLSQQSINDRLNIINNLINNQNTSFVLESCYYGLCADLIGENLHSLHFWKPHVNKDRNITDVHRFEYIPINNDWGRLRLAVSDEYWLTIIPNENRIKLSRIMIHDSQLWKIERIKMKKENCDNIWIRIINKLGYKLIFEWKSLNHHSLNSNMPILSISNKINEIDPLCIDVFSVAKNRYCTRYRVYFEKYTLNKDVLSKIGGQTNKHSFWRLSVDGSKLYQTKYDCYKFKLRRIAQILWQFKQRYIQSLNDGICNNNNYHSTKRRSSPPPPPPLYHNHDNNRSLQDLACILLPRCPNGNICKYGHPDKYNGKQYYCQFDKACRFGPKLCRNNHNYEWSTDATPKQYICQFWDKGGKGCKSDANQCRMYHPNGKKSNI